MAAGNMLRLTQTFSAINIHSTSWSICQRGISNKSLLEKLGLPEKPKRPMTPFFLFKETVRPEILRKNPGVGVTEVTRIASKLWKEVDENEKERLTGQFQQEYQKYKLELQRYEKSLSSEQKAEIREAEADIKALKEQKLIKQVKQKREKELKKPKSPLLPFIRFVMSNERGSNSHKEHMKKMGEKWSKLSDNTKQKYIDEYEQEREQYMKVLAQWEEEMIKQGHVDVVRSKTLKHKLKIYS